MKFSADKAGKKAKCSKCGAIVPIEAPPETEPEQEPEPAPVVKAAEEEEDGTGSYGLYTDPELEERKKQLEAEEEAKANPKKKDRKKLPKVARKIKAIADAESWEKVRLGMFFVFLGVCVWIVAHLLQGSYVLIGSVEFPEYAPLLATYLASRNNDDFPARGHGWDIDQMSICLGIISGRAFLGYAQFCIVVVTGLYFLQAILWGVGYALCLPVPRRYGMFGQLLAALGLAGFNVLCVFAFKLLPVLGAHGYVLIPYLTPEVAMTEYNMERLVPIHVLWSGAPFWENLLTLVLRFSAYLEPAFFCIFIWSVGLIVKEDEIEQGGKGRTQMCLGTMFMLLTYQLLSLCGASPVMVILLRVIYTVWFSFALIFMLQYIMLLVKCRTVLQEKINPTNELEE